MVLIALWSSPSVLYVVPATIETNKLPRLFAPSWVPILCCCWFFEANIIFHFFVLSVHSNNFGNFPPGICWHLWVLILRQWLLISLIHSIMTVKTLTHSHMEVVAVIAHNEIKTIKFWIGTRNWCAANKVSSYFSCLTLVPCWAFNIHITQTKVQHLINQFRVTIWCRCVWIIIALYFRVLKRKTTRNKYIIQLRPCPH